MSIASEITRLQNSKADVKTQVNIDKDLINSGTAFIDDETLDDYDDKIEEMQEAYKKFIPIQTGTGTSSVTLDNTNDDKVLTGLKLYGNTEQTTYTGKNLINVKNQTGTISSEFPYFYSFNTGFTMTAGQTYTLSFDITASESPFAVSIGSGSTYYRYDTYSQTNLSNGHCTITFTPTAETMPYGNTMFVRAPRYSTSQVGDSVTISNIQLEKGSSGTDFEPYVGGTASPSTNYPQELKVVTGDTNVVVSGKNLLHIENENIPSNNWYTYNETTQKFKIVQGTQNWAGQIPIDIDINVGDTITISFILESGKYTTGAITLGLYHLGSPNKWEGYKELPINTDLSGQTYSVTQTIDADVTGFAVFTYSLPTITEDIVFKVQIEKNSTNTVYEPYRTPVSYPISLGIPNMFDKNKVTTSAWLKEDGTLLTGMGGYSTSDYIPVFPNQTYYKSITGSPRTKYYDSSLQPLNTTAYQDISVGGSAGSFTVPNNCYFIRLTIYTDNYSLDSISIIKGSEAHTTTDNPIELAKISTYKDSIYKNLTDNEWYVGKIVGKKILKGTETWNGQAGAHTVVLNTYTSMGDWGAVTQRQPVYCNYLSYNSSAGVNNDSVINILSPNTQGTNLLVDVSKTEFPNLNNFTAWLEKHNLIVYYVLATTNAIKITDTTLKGQLDAISLETGTNIFTFDGDTLVSGFDVNYIGEANLHL